MKFMSRPNQDLDVLHSIVRSESWRIRSKSRTSDKKANSVASMQIGDRVRYGESVQPDEVGTIIDLIGCSEEGLTLDILLDTGAQIRVVGPGRWAIVEPG